MNRRMNQKKNQQMTEEIDLAQEMIPHENDHARVMIHRLQTEEVLSAKIDPDPEMIGTNPPRISETDQ